MPVVVDTYAAPLRQGLLGLATLTSVALAVELAVERHWTQPAQLIAWAAIALLALAIGLSGGIRPTAACASDGCS